jgi:cardiolipin synthase
MTHSQLRHLPNVITILRILLIAPVLIALLHQQYTLAFYLFLLAGVSDALDGLLARYFNCASRFGAFIDPLADKLLLIGSFFTLGWLGHIPLELVIVVIARDIWIMGGALAYLYFIGRLEFMPTLISKINTFLQLLLIIVLLLQLSFSTFPPLLIQTVFYTVFVTTIISFIQYTWQWANNAVKNYTP